MAIIIPWQNSFHFRFDITLDGVVYVMQARFNPVSNLYVVDFFTRDRVLIIGGVALVRNVDLLDNTHEIPGSMVVVGEAPTLEALLNKSSQIVYLTEDEIENG